MLARCGLTRGGATVRRVPLTALIGPVLFGLLVLLTLISPRRPRPLAQLGFRVASVYNEAPFPFIYLIVLFAVGPLAGARFDSPIDWLVLGVTAAVILGFLIIAWLGARERPLVELALEDGLGAGWRDRAGSDLLQRVGRPPLARILLMPFVLRPLRVRRVANVRYGEAAGRFNLLDLYHHRDLPHEAPVLVYFHAGGYYGGRKSFGARALLFRLASQGWVTISANYRLRPEADFFDHLGDVKRVIAWVRENGHAYGADPEMLFVSGGSAGGHLASIAALTQNQPRYQPGIEDADTSVAAVVSLYGWYGGYYEMGGVRSEVGVLGHPASDAPPFFIAHGRKDSLAPIESARQFVAHLRRESHNPVVFAELAHGQHNFDLFHSFRFSAVIDAFEVFAAWVRSSHAEVR